MAVKSVLIRLASPPMIGEVVTEVALLEAEGSSVEAEAEVVVETEDMVEAAALKTEVEVTKAVDPGITMAGVMEAMVIVPEDPTGIVMTAILHKSKIHS